MGDADVILFVSGGTGVVEIGEKSFDIETTDGVYVRAGEGFRLTPGAGETLTVLAAGLPAAAALSFPDAWPKPFDASAPERVVRVDADQRHAMGERWFQMLVDKAVGSTTAAQFIGHIPLSKAEPHRHLYEESIICLKGEGMMWTETKKARVKAGDRDLPAAQTAALAGVHGRRRHGSGGRYPPGRQSGDQLLSMDSDSTVGRARRLRKRMSLPEVVFWMNSGSARADWP